MGPNRYAAFPSEIHTSLKEVAVGALIASLILNSCGAPVRESVANIEAGSNASMLGEAEWVERLRFWLRVGYLEQPSTAAFASIDPDLLRSPSLYTTFAAAGIREQLELPVEEPQAIVDWLQGLMLAGGAFDDANLPLPLLIETNWAVHILRWTGADTGAQWETRGFILGLLGEDGLFHPDQSIGGSELEQALIASDYAVEALLLLGETPESAALRRCAQALRQSLADLLRDDGQSGSDRSATYIIGAAHTLAAIDPSLLSDEARLYLDASPLDLDSLGTDPGSLSQVSMLLEIHRLLGHPISAEEGPLRRYAAERVAPLIEAGEGRSPFDPIMTYQAIRVLAQVGFTPVDGSAVLGALDRYRIRGGWITAVIPLPDPRATFYALEIIDTIGGVAFQPQSVRDYLLPRVIPPEGPLDLDEVFAGVMGLEKLGFGVDEALQAELRSLMIRQRWSQTAPPKNGDGPYWLARIYRQLESDPPPDLRVALERRGEALAASPPDLSVGEIDYLLAIEAVLGRGFVGDEEIAAQLMRLWGRQGGFRASPGISDADLHSTYLAVNSLARLGKLDMVPREAVLDYLETCRADYGFSYVVWKDRSGSIAGGRVQPDFRSTYEGLHILNALTASGP